MNKNNDLKTWHDGADIVRLDGTLHTIDAAKQTTSNVTFFVADLMNDEISFEADS